MNPLLKEILEGVYNEKYQFSKDRLETVVRGFENGKRSFFNDRLRSIKKRRTFGKLLDVGCNYGIFLKLAKENGYQVYGVDMSQSAIKYARNELKLNVECKTLKGANFPSEYFDVISMFDVIEHVKDPIGELQEIHRVLKKDGLFFLTTPNVKVYMLKAQIVKMFPFLAYYKDNFTGTPYKANEFGLPYHINFFTPGSLTKMLIEAGFKDVSFDLCMKEKYHGRYLRNLLRMLHVMMVWLLFKLFRVYMPAEISAYAGK
ncbi:MAG: class I SAM-dependent methyltransferase [Candidatus Omnitrophica bacterium]|nr:class I SAM-dependent methyltransferase [Candidatus Omnitrophota bacterium]MDD5429315.1 class I SAM-dependent methyltransferase [Candidatus Omnitrophota bacterium]